MKPILIVALPALVLCGTCATSFSAEGPDRIGRSTLETHLGKLASEEFLGRGTAEEGTRLAEEYIAAQFRKFGLNPLPGHSDFFLDFTLYAAQFNLEATGLQWMTNDSARSGGRATPGDTMRPFPFSDEGSVEGPVVFAGYGISAPDLNYDDYEGLDVEGKLVLILRHEPREMDEESPFDGTASTDHATFATKARTAQERGALGMILVTDPLHHEGGDDLRLYNSFQLEPDEPEGRARGEGADDAEEGPFLAVHVSQEVGNQLFASSGRSLRDVQTEIDQGLWPVRVSLGDLRARVSVDRLDELKAFPARNVAGYLEGSAPDHVDEWVMIGGHHDHLGAYTGAGDTTYNGADDNGSGTAGVLQLAEAFASRAQRPKRSMVFTTFAAEEMGLLGSEAMVEQGQIPLENVFFLLNIDMIGRNADQPLAFTGDGFARGLSDIVTAALEETTMEVAWGGMTYTGRTDHAAFYARGIPFLTFFSGFHDQYHQLDDHIELIEFDKLEQTIQLAYGIADRVAELDQGLSFIHDVSWLGLHAEVVEDGGTPRTVVSFVDEDSKARAVDFREGDFIDEINEKNASADLADLLATIEPGSNVTFKVTRPGHQAKLLEVERAKVGYMGVWPGQIGQEQREELGLKDNEGILLRNVVEGGPCGEAGLESGDVVLEIGGRMVNSRSLRGTLSQIGAGETVDVVVLRDGETRTFSVTLGERPQRG